MPNVDVAAGPFLSKPLKGMMKSADDVAGAAATKSGDIADDFFNFRRLNLSDEGEALLRDRINVRVAEGDMAKGYLPDTELRQLALDVADPESLALLKPKRVGEGAYSAPVSLAVRDAIKTKTQELIDLERGLDKLVDKKQVGQRLARIQHVEETLNGLMDVGYTSAGEAGRTLRSYRLLAQETTDLDFWMNRLGRKVGHVSSKDATTLDDILQGIRTADSDEAKSLGRLRLAKFMKSQDRDGWLTTIGAVRKAGLLSGLKTHLRNTAGNLGFAGVREAGQAGEWAFDSIFSLFTGNKTIAPPGVNVGSAVHKSLTQGLREGWQTFKHGMTLDEAGKLDVENIRELDTKIFSFFGKPGEKMNAGINWWVNKNFRALAAEDRVFRTYAFDKAINDGAYVIARGMKMRGELPHGMSIMEKAKQIASAPPPELTAEAMYGMEYAVFANENKVASAIESAKSKSDYIRFTADLAMPFVKTPTNIFARMIEYSPVGGLINGGTVGKDIFRRGFNAEQQKALSQALGRGAVGTALIFAGMKLRENGMLVGMPSDVYGERAVQMAAGRQPLSFHYDGTYYRINELQPGAGLLLAGASIYDELQGESSLSEVLQTAGEVTVEMGKELPLSQGIEIASRALNSPGKFGSQYVREQLGTMVPTLMADAARASDDKVRTTHTNDAGYMASVKERLPWLRKQLPPLTNVYGRDIESNPLHAIDPSLHTKETTDPMALEMANQEFGITPPRQGPDEPDRDYLLRRRVYGMIIADEMQRNMKLRSWAGASREDKEKDLRDAKYEAGERTRSASYEELMKELRRLQ